MSLFFLLVRYIGKNPKYQEGGFLMKLEKLGLTVIALSLAIGGGMPNMSYAMESKKQALIDVNYHIITPFLEQYQ